MITARPALTTRSENRASAGTGAGATCAWRHQPRDSRPTQDRLRRRTPSLCRILIAPAPHDPPQPSALRDVRPVHAWRQIGWSRRRLQVRQINLAPLMRQNGSAGAHVAIGRPVVHQVAQLDLRPVLGCKADDTILARPLALPARDAKDHVRIVRQSGLPPVHAAVGNRAGTASSALAPAPPDSARKDGAMSQTRYFSRSLR